MHCLYCISGLRILKNSFSGIHDVYHTAIAPDPPSQGLAGLRISAVLHTIALAHITPSFTHLPGPLTASMRGYDSRQRTIAQDKKYIAARRRIRSFISGPIYRLARPVDFRRSNLAQWTSREERDVIVVQCLVFYLQNISTAV